MKVLIIGAGIVGLSTAWALVRNGHNVTILDQSTIPNPSSASFDQHRMIRPQYGDQTGYTQMISEAFNSWEQLWQDLGEIHYSETGVMAVDLGNEDWMHATKHALQVTNTPFDLLDRKGIESKAPQLHIPSTAWGLHAPRAGVLFADRIVTSMSRWLTGQGVTFHENCRVIETDFQKAIVRCQGGEVFEADKLVIAVGAWLPQILPQYSNFVKSVRSTVAYISPPRCFAPAWEYGPALFLITPKSYLYCLPPVDGTDLKFGGAPILRPAGAMSILSVSHSEQQSILSAFSPFLSDAENYQTLRGAGGYYADPVDKKFIIEQHHKAIVVTGCGGRMFKFGTAVGLRIASAFEPGATKCDITEWARGSGLITRR